MATQQQTPARPAPFAPDSIIWRKYGPMPVWAWALLVLAAALVFSWWRRDRRRGGVDLVDDADWPGDQTPPPVFIVPTSPPPPVNVTVPVTVPSAPPGGGAPSPSQPPRVPAPIPKPPGGYVDVTPYPDKTRPKESTLYDIAGAWLPEGAAHWQKIWTHPLNADLVRRRGKPERIRPKDRIFVPNKLQVPR